jgi:group I intron endonuclease
MGTILSGIYRITNVLNGHVYVGSSKSIKNRWKQHRYVLRRGTHHSKYLQRAWEKYGEENFLFEIMELCDPTRELLLEREQHHIDALKPVYNVLPVAGSPLGTTVSDETRAKISEAARSITPETREKMAAAKRGATASHETRERMSQAHMGRSKNPTSIQKTIAVRNERRLEKLSKIEIKTNLIKNDVRHQLRTLTEDQVRIIRSSTETDLTLSKAYSCSPTTISRIRKRITYKDVL